MAQQPNKGDSSNQGGPSKQGNNPGAKSTGNEGANKQGAQRPQGGQPPRYDDRPDVESTGGQTEGRPGKSTGTGPGYGDQEPGDPRRTNIEGSSRPASGGGKTGGQTNSGGPGKTGGSGQPGGGSGRTGSGGT